MYNKKAIRRLAFNVYLRQSIINKATLMEPLPYCRELFHKWGELNSFLTAANQLENKKGFSNPRTTFNVGRYGGTLFNGPMLDKISQTQQIKDSSTKSSKSEKSLPEHTSKRGLEKNKPRRSKRSLST